MSLNSTITTHSKEIAEYIAENLKKEKGFTTLEDAKKFLTPFFLKEDHQDYFRQQIAIDHLAFPEESTLLLKACKKCLRRGYLGITVSYKKGKTGKYIRDEEGNPILEHSHKKPCNCILKQIKVPGTAHVKELMLAYYEKTLGNQTEEKTLEANQSPKPKRKGKTTGESGGVHNKPTTTPKKKSIPKG